MKSGSVVDVAEFDGSKCKKQTASGETYLSTEEGVNYLYSLDGTNWQKTETTNSASADIANLVDKFKNKLTWAEYDGTKLTGTFNNDGEVYSANATVSNNKLDVVATTNSDKLELTLDKSKTNTVALPEVKTEEKVEVYNATTGKWNVKLLANTIEEWFAETTYYKDVINFGLGNTILKNIFYVTPVEKGMEFGALTETKGTKAINFFTINSAIVENFKTATSKDGIKKVLSAETKPIKRKENSESNTKYEYSTIDVTQEQLQQFNAMTTSIFSKLSTEVSGLETANVLFGFKTPKSSPFAAGENGYMVGWNQYYIVNINNQVKLVSMHIASSNDRGSGEIGNVIDNTKYWSISELKIENLVNENKTLFESNLKAEKNREF